MNACPPLPRQANGSTTTAVRFEHVVAPGVVSSGCGGVPRPGSRPRLRVLFKSEVVERITVFFVCVLSEATSPRQAGRSTVRCGRLGVRLYGYAAAAARAGVPRRLQCSENRHITLSSLWPSPYPSCRSVFHNLALKQRSGATCRDPCTLRPSTEGEGRSPGTSARAHSRIRVSLTGQRKPPPPPTYTACARQQPLPVS